ncbi:hypothetical protein AKJ41_02000 [candidate division MSBL1 archaeon SCGC-AAA259O05]|uniref:Uncharacterized protein n=1 Tax=candidate division MSBL1 archaeon SCGC-AAA259O05 TaxID=1698271 RepID=A0A133V4E2_9EURY|nr:hypothetical protein AKJ41_02000 [candidate division MSBL1 archaeon SCGC-AAA259O05]
MELIRRTSPKTEQEKRKNEIRSPDRNEMHEVEVDPVEASRVFRVLGGFEYPFLLLIFKATRIFGNRSEGKSRSNRNPHVWT